MKRECKVIHIRINPILTARKVSEKRVGTFDVSTYDSPALEEELNRYLAQGYHLVKELRWDGAYYSFYLEREIN